MINTNSLEHMYTSSYSITKLWPAMLSQKKTYLNIQNTGTQHTMTSLLRQAPALNFKANTSLYSRHLHNLNICQLQSLDQVRSQYELKEKLVQFLRTCGYHAELDTLDSVKKNIQSLFDKGLDVQQPHNGLPLALYVKNFELLDLLMGHGLDIQPKGYANKTLLHKFIGDERLFAHTHLLKKINPLEQDNFQQTALHYYLDRGSNQHAIRPIYTQFVMHQEERFEAYPIDTFQKIGYKKSFRTELVRLIIEAMQGIKYDVATSAGETYLYKALKPFKIYEKTTFDDSTVIKRVLNKELIDVILQAFYPSSNYQLRLANHKIIKLLKEELTKKSYLNENQVDRAAYHTDIVDTAHKLYTYGILSLNEFNTIVDEFNTIVELEAQQ